MIKKTSPIKDISLLQFLPVSIYMVLARCLKAAISLLIIYFHSICSSEVQNGFD